jgi:hypothetical protein
MVYQVRDLNLPSKITETMGQGQSKLQKNTQQAYVDITINLSYTKTQVRGMK